MFEMQLRAAPFPSVAGKTLTKRGRKYARTSTGTTGLGDWNGVGLLVMLAAGVA